MHRLVLALACAAAPLPMLAQAPGLRVGTEIVLVDVTVTDSHGKPVPHLSQADFSVAEDGRAQQVTHFEEHAAPTAAQLAKLPQMPALGPNVYTNFTPVPEDGPINVLLLDYLNTPIDGQGRARQQIITFLKALKPGTRIAIFGLNARLVMLQGFTSDSQKLLAVLTGPKGNPGKSPLIGDKLGTERPSDYAALLGSSGSVIDLGLKMQQLEAMQNAQQQTQRAQITLGAMNLLARYLSSIPGRKNLIWFSASFPISILPDPNLQEQTATYQQNPFSTVNSSADQFRQTVRLFSQSQVAVYPVDARGLFTDGLSSADQSIFRNGLNPKARTQDLDTFTNQTFDEHITMRQMADATGGYAYLNINNLSDAVERAIDSGSNYYTLSYSPTNKAHDGSFRKIAVKLATGGRYTLNYRKGYYTAQPEESKPQRKETSGKPVQASAPPDPMRIAMQFGAPSISQIIFKALVVAGETPVSKAPEGNVLSPKAGAPYRVVTVAYAVNPGDLSLPQQPDGSRQVNLQFVALVYDRDGQVINQQISAVNVMVKPAVYQQLVQEGVRFQQQIAVPAKGDFYLRTGVHDLIGDTVGVIEVATAAIAKQ